MSNAGRQSFTDKMGSSMKVRPRAASFRLVRCDAATMLT